jgi:hypothetical protein
VTFIKPGIDAARVARGNEIDDGLATATPLEELAASKMVEMVFESLPAGACATHRHNGFTLHLPSLPQPHAAIIQTRAFIISKERSTAALASIIISCCTTGFAAATLWYDYDTLPLKRKRNPKLAGATPNTNRGLFFVTLVTHGALQVVAKSFSSALLYIVSPNIFFAYTVGDHVMYQLYLAKRGDHRDFRPGPGIPLSVLTNACVKAVADFTSCWLMRNPLTMHNSYFLFNQLTAHASVFVCVHVYLGSGSTNLPARVLWMSASSLFVAWALTYVMRARERTKSPRLSFPSRTQVHHPRAHGQARVPAHFLHRGDRRSVHPCGARRRQDR